MPAVRNPEDAKQSAGRVRADEFTGRMWEFEDDIPGDYGDQCIFRYSDVEVILAPDDFEDPAGAIEEKHKQSDHVNSLYIKKLQVFSNFANTHKFLDGDVWQSFYGKFLRYKSEELIEATTNAKGVTFSAGITYVPVEVMEDEGPSAPDAKVMAAIEAALEDNEQTVAQLTRTVNKREALRSKLEASGGIRTVLQYMVEEGTLSKEGNVYLLKEE